MNRQQAKELLPVIQAFAEGKTIEFKNAFGNWNDCNEVLFNYPTKDYRIKPEPKYRPFVNNKECWNEMLRHKPFGWVKDKKLNNYFIIDGVYYSESFDYPVASMAGEAFTYKEMIDNYLFADGTPFGIKE